MSTQLAMFQGAPRRSHNYEHQLLAIVAAVGDGVPRSLAEIERAVQFKYSQTSVSARIRELRRGFLHGWTSEHTKREGRHYYAVRRLHA